MSIEETERKLQSHDPCHAQCVLFMYYAALYVLVLTLRNLRINLMYAYFIFFYLMMMEAKCTQKTMAWHGLAGRQAGSLRTICKILSLMDTHAVDSQPK